MITIEGPPSHSPFRLNQLLTELQNIDSSIASIGARYIHFIDNTKKLSDEENNILLSLLAYGPGLIVATGVLSPIDIASPKDDL